MSQPRRFRSDQLAKAAFIWLSFLIASAPWLAAQAPSDTAAFSKLAWSTDSTGPRRFVSVHGRRAAIFGYPQDHGLSGDGGLEVWAYPVQILRSYSVAFRPALETTAIDGETILRRIVYSPEAVTRIYAGPGFIVREKLFVPLDEPGAIIFYEVESPRPIEIEIRFIPVLDLMWPASIGGQETVWNSAASAYSMAELTHRFTASIGSPDVIAHDSTQNSAKNVWRRPGLGFTIRADGRKPARVIIAGIGPGQDLNTTAKKLLTESTSLEKEAIDHYSSLLSHALQIETPDPETNRALAWSEIALDQAWVCNPDLGCGQIAGYGPSRRARRPQYDWFFAGDGMVAVPALLAAGQYERAREELDFILKYQDKKSGMIWHELSQSAGLLDWDNYPYMFVHVELTFDFLNTVGDYFSATGDRDFVKANWGSIQSAYEYCRSLIDPKDKDGLPRIPSGKQGAREQDPLSDELALSASWVTAAQAFADLAAATGHNEQTAEAKVAGQRARQAIGQRYWDERRNFWITGYTRSGTPLIGRDIGPVSIVRKPFLSQAQRNSVIDQLAASDFQTDWGTRGRASSASTYDPNSYASGSVWAVSTSGVASAFWAEHRPATALPIWSALVPWSSLDSLGHMHEALAGDYYHEEVESVPEQTWSSAAFFTASVNGLLGVQVDGVSHRITFAPHLPPKWDAITLRNLRAGSSEIDLKMVRSGSEVRLELQNRGAPVEFVFDPEIPLGAKLGSAQLGQQSITATPVTATLEGNPQDTHAKIGFSLPNGSVVLTIPYTGGVEIITEPAELMIGEPAKAIKITGVGLKGRVYSVDFDYVPSERSSFEVRTPWKIKKAQGASFENISSNLYRVMISTSPREKEPDAYRHGKVVVTFAREGLD